jgi:hypothetical protein
MTTVLEVLKDISSRLEGAKLSYFLVGSLAAMYYSRPRMTNDIDLVVEVKASDLKKFKELFKIEDYYCPPEEILRDEVLRQGSFNLIHQKSGLKVDIVLLKNTEFYQSEFVRRKKLLLAPELEVYIATPEDIIIKKLDYYREGGSEKHLSDIREIVAATALDQAYLQKWLAHFGLNQFWDKT